MTNYELFQKGLSYEATDEQDAFDFYPWLFHLTGTNVLWQLEVLDRMLWPGGNHEQEVRALARKLAPSVPADAWKIAMVQEMADRLGIAR